MAAARSGSPNKVIDVLVRSYVRPAHQEVIVQRS